MSKAESTIGNSTTGRSATRLGASLNKNLVSYAIAASAAGVGLLALAQPAEARIVYTPAHRKLPLNGDLFLDVNHDGINDFRFHIATFDANVRGTSGTQDSAFLWAYPQGTANQVFGNQPYASALRAGVRIGPKGCLTQGRGTMGGGIFTGAPQYLGPWADSGKAVNHRYVGLKFVIHGKVHFGWARLNVRVYRNPEATVSAVLTGYAYETVPNKPIVAGKTKSPDRVNADQNVSLSAPPTQTATLGLLALGSPALSIWRREESVGAKQ